MGTLVASVIKDVEDIKIVAGVDKTGDQNIHAFPVYKSFEECNGEGDVVVDFSRPDALASILHYALESSLGVIIATTGHLKEQIDKLKAASERIPVFISPNMSYGISLTLDLVKQASEVLGKAFDIEIVEKHHNRKVDSPSGTTLSIANQINSVFNGSKRFVFGRKTHNQPRKSDEIGIHSVSGGNVCGENQVIFLGQDEAVEITHRVYSKDAYASGTIRAIRFIADRPHGYYSMNDLFRN